MGGGAAYWCVCVLVLRGHCGALRPEGVLWGLFGVNFGLGSGETALLKKKSGVRTKGVWEVV